MQHAFHSVEIASTAPKSRSEHRTAASYERELERYRRAELQLREIIALMRACFVKETRRSKIKRS